MAPGSKSTTSADPTTVSQRVSVDMRAEYTSRIRDAEMECGMRNFDPTQSAEEESWIRTIQERMIRLEYDSRAD